MNTRTHISQALRLTALAATLAVAGAAPAHADYSYYRSGSSAHQVVDGNVVDVQVRVNGSAAPLYFRPGTNDRHYFQAYRGRNYSLVLRNNTGRRIGVLVAVDGLNVVNGERSGLDRGEAMYVLGPWEQAEIQGWRTSLNEVRKFVFVDEERSYAQRTGQANGDMGWIRVAAFREVEPQAWWPYRPKVSDDHAWNDERGSRRENAAPAPPSAPSTKAAPESQLRADGGANMAPRDEESNPGTGWGNREYDPVGETSFVAEKYATDRITLRYEYANGLQALGIVPQRAPRIWDREQGQLGFAQPPRW